MIPRVSSPTLCHTPPGPSILQLSPIVYGDITVVGTLEKAQKVFCKREVVSPNKNFQTFLNCFDALKFTFSLSLLSTSVYLPLSLFLFCVYISPLSRYVTQILSISFCLYFLRHSSSLHLSVFHHLSFTSFY